MQPPSLGVSSQLAIFESITDSFIVVDEGLRIVQANRAAAVLARRDQDTLPGCRLTDLPYTCGPALEAGLQRVLLDRTPVIVESFVASVDRWFESSVFPLEAGLSVYTRDVTIRKRALELTSRLARHSALRADVSTALSDDGELPTMLTECCEAIVRHLGVAFARVWTVDPARTTLLLQASAGRYTRTDGAYHAVPIGERTVGRIAAERRPFLTNEVAQDPRIGDPAWAAGEGLVAFAGYPLLVDGEVIGVLALFATQALPEDTASALAGIADTIAQGLRRRRAELELEQRVAELARSNADLEQFAYVASHDLQEPLRMVASYNQLLARRYQGKLGSDADEFIGFTVEGVTRMQRLINELLAYSRVGTRGGELAEVELAHVLEVVTANLRSALAETAATITHDPLPRLHADEGQLVQVMQNLIGNALKFRADAPPAIHVGVRAAGANWELSVRDNGIGIDPAYFERIFVLFQRLHPRENYPGTGMGLAICKKIVERHGGKIWVESRPGAGTTIAFTIPRRQT